MAKGVKVTDRDKGYKALMQRVRSAAKGRAVQVGLLGETDDDTLKIGTFHEFGVGHNPERSFVRGWFDEFLTENKAVEKKMAESVVKGQNTVHSALKRMGHLFEATMQARIRGGIGEPLSPRQIREKGHDTQLIHNNQLLTGIKSKVE